MLPDIDFLFGGHSTYTHSLGATLLVGLSVALVSRDARSRTGLAAAAAYGSHLLLDWLGDDRAPPVGIMALWPLSDGFYQSDLHWFMAILRRDWLATFWTHNGAAMAREVGLLAPIAMVVWWLRRR